MKRLVLFAFLVCSLWGGDAVAEERRRPRHGRVDVVDGRDHVLSPAKQFGVVVGEDGGDAAEVEPLDRVERQALMREAERDAVSADRLEALGHDRAEAARGTREDAQSGVEPVVDEDHPVFKLLARISDLVMQTLGTGSGRATKSARIAKQASALYRIIHDYLQGRVSSETYPERKLIIRTLNRPNFGRDGIVLSKASVELIGDFADIFGITTTQTIGREFTWLEVCDKIPAELRANCIAGIQQLATTVLKGGGDNYHVVTTIPRDKSFRMFVSKVVTYVSQKTEIHIYVVQMRTRDYGDPQSTRLLKAISVGLRFRSLVLEDQSQFRPEKLGHPVVTAADLKAKVSEMLGQMDLILREAVEADLSDPAFLILIWGKKQEKKVQDMIDVWEKTRRQLYAAADEVLSASDDDNFRRKKENFVKALQAFGGEIETMNRDYTSRILTLLRDYVEQKISLSSNEEKSVTTG